MNEIKVNSIKFLMNMFDNTPKDSQSVRGYKKTVNDLVSKRQISVEVRDIIFNIYGITNSDIFRPNTQSNKLMQLNYFITSFENSNFNSMDDKLHHFKNYIDNASHNGMILDTVKDILYDIYDLRDTSIKKSSMPVIDKDKVGLNVDKGVDSQSLKTDRPRNSNVISDIRKFKSEYLKDIYYEYENPSFDGCSGSPKYLHLNILKATNRPPYSKIVYYAVISDDGCHQTHSYIDVPKECYEKSTVSKPSVSSDPCSHGFRSSGC